MIMRHALLNAALLIGCTVALPALAVDGLITRPSPHSVDATIEKFEAAARKRGFVVFTRLDHAAAAESVGLKMPRSTVIVFGNPRAGTPIFIKFPTYAIDVPPKALVWEDSSGKVFLSYNSAAYISGTLYPRHSSQASIGGSDQTEKAFAAIADEALQ